MSPVRATPTATPTVGAPVKAIAVSVGATGGVLLGNAMQFLEHLWDMSDTLNGLMAVPNLVALLILSGEVRRLVSDFDKKRRSGEIKI